MWGLNAASEEEQAKRKVQEKEEEVRETETDGEKSREEEGQRGGRVAVSELPCPACK